MKTRIGLNSLVSFVIACQLLLGAPLVPAHAGPAFTMDQTLSDQAQRTTLAFAGLGMITGNLAAQSFFPPGKVADYTGFQYLRDNDPSDMGHNTSFLTRVANNVLYILNDSQLAQLKTLAVAQQDQINQYGYKRFTLMQAFRQLLEGTGPAGSAGLDLDAVKKASRQLYLLDGQISFDRALLYAGIYQSMDDSQKAYLDAMKGKGWSSWPDIADSQIRSKMQSLPQGTAVAVMTYAGDLFSWYAGSVDADVYFCPERHGTYFGSFYMKDAPAIGHEGYSINEQLTATAGAALCDSSKGYVTSSQAAAISSLVDLQRNNLYAGTPNIVSIRTQIATLLRGLISSTQDKDSVQSQVMALSGTYGELDGENNYHYATVFTQVRNTFSQSQLTRLASLRSAIMSGTYSGGTTFDFSICTTPFLYSSPITDQTILSPYLSDAQGLFLPATSPKAAFSLVSGTGTTPLSVTFKDSSTGYITSRHWDFGDGSTLESTGTSVSHSYLASGTFSPSLTVASSSGTSIYTAAGAVIATPHYLAPTLTQMLETSCTLGQPFQYQIPATNHPTSFSAAGLPIGLNLDSATGIISGTTSESTNHWVQVTASNPAGVATAWLMIRIQIPVAEVTSSLAAIGTQGTAFLYQIQAAPYPVQYAASGLPAGLYLNRATGVISGKPAVSGSFNVTLQITNPGGISSASLALVILEPAPVLTSRSSLTTIAGQPFTYQIQATHNPTRFEADGLPAGLSLDPSSGIISGTAASEGAASIILRASNPAGTGTKTLVLKIRPAFPGITLDLENAKIGSVTATLEVDVQASSVAAKLWVDYGLSDSHGKKSRLFPLPASGTAQRVTIPLTGLIPHTLHHFRIKGVNASGVSVSADYQFQTAPQSNITGQGDAELFMQDSAGQLSMAGDLTTSGTIANLGLTISGSMSWCGLADISNSGTQQLIFANTATRRLEFWNPGEPTAAIGPNYWKTLVPIAVEDITADGIPDLVALNSSSHHVEFWGFNKTRFISRRIGPLMPEGFTLVAVDDFSGDCRPDLLLWNQSTGETRILVLNGTALGEVLQGSSIPEGWLLVGADDCDGDGIAEWILFQPATGETQFWKFNSQGVKTSAQPGVVLPKDSTVLSVK